MRHQKILIGIGLSVAFALLSVVSWHYIKQSADPLAMELTVLSPHLTAPPIFDTKEVVAALRFLEINFREVPHAALLLTRLITLEREISIVPPRPPHGLAWVKYKQNAPRNIQSKMTQWESMEPWCPLATFIFDLYEKNYGSTRASLHFLLNYKNRLPYLHLLVARAIFENTGKEIPYVFFETPSAETKSLILKLFADESMLKWAKSKKSNLKHFGGTASTVIGVYDWIAMPQYAEKVGFPLFPKKADVYWDYGGGFATPDISRLIGKKFTSVDILSPQSARTLDARFYVMKDWLLPSLLPHALRPQTPKERETYLRELDKTPWLEYDIFSGPLPSDQQSYFITSFGFLSSTVASQSSLAPYENAPQIPRHIITTYIGARRIMELVAKGKDVDLFSYERATSRPYRIRTIFMSFRNRRLVKDVLLPVDMGEPTGRLENF